jgi:hypothetical protein
MTTPLRTRILLADDHPVVRRGLRLMLESEPDLVVVAETGDGAQAVERGDRGRDRRCWRPPAQIPACAANALGSCLGFWRRIVAEARGAGCGQLGAIGLRSVVSGPRSCVSVGCGVGAPGARPR